MFDFEKPPIGKEGEKKETPLDDLLKLAKEIKEKESETKEEKREERKEPEIEREKLEKAFERVLSQEEKAIEEGGNVVYKLLSNPELKNLRDEAEWRNVSSSEIVQTWNKLFPNQKMEKGKGEHIREILYQLIQGSSYYNYEITPQNLLEKTDEANEVIRKLIEEEKEFLADKTRNEQLNLAEEVIERKFGTSVVRSVFLKEPNNPQEYFSKFQETMDKIRKELEEEIENLQKQHKEALEKNDLEEAKRIENEMKYYQDRMKGTEIGAKLQMRGFGKSALESGDLEVAIDSLNFSGDLRNDEILNSLKEKLSSLQESEPARAKKAAEKLLKVLG